MFPVTILYIFGAYMLGLVSGASLDKKYVELEDDKPKEVYVVKNEKKGNK